MAIDTDRFKRGAISRPVRPIRPPVVREVVVPKVEVKQGSVETVPSSPLVTEKTEHKLPRAKISADSKRFELFTGTLPAKLKPVLSKVPFGTQTKIISAAIVLVIIISGAVYGLTRSPSEPKDTSIPAAGSSLTVGTAPINDSASLPVIERTSAAATAAPATAAKPAAAKPVVTKAAFTPVAPLDKPQLAHTGTYNTDKSSYNFSDLLLAEPVQVSEQILPTGYASPASAIATVASKIGANKTITGTKYGTAYVDDTYQSNNQHVMVFTAKGNLVFVLSSYGYSNPGWAQYVNEY